MNTKFENGLHFLSFNISEENLPRKNYDNITIECRKNNQSRQVHTNKCKEIQTGLQCICDSLEMATKYEVNISTNKENWTPQKIKMPDQFTSK